MQRPINTVTMRHPTECTYDGYSQSGCVFKEREGLALMVIQYSYKPLTHPSCSEIGIEDLSFVKRLVG